MTAIDLRRTVPLRIVDDLPDHDPATPGDAQPLVHGDGEPAGFVSCAAVCAVCAVAGGVAYCAPVVDGGADTGDVE